ncbi:hypothetical protein BJY01DRAFT_255713 [Aspergillus pseudoustus]|uniref:Peptidase C39 domain-containing protein n=1 Tax=Aspergillus pseudoustus TaxID=1810923 RepID=A0ABR4II51_9EURO
MKFSDSSCGLATLGCTLVAMGHSSLDYPFRDAQLLFNHTLSLLKDLGKIGIQLLTVLDSNVQENDDDVSEDSEEEDMASYQDKPLLELLTESAAAAIDKGYRVAFKLRSPAMRLGSSPALGYREIDGKTDVDLIEKVTLLDYGYVQDLFHTYSPSHDHDRYLIPRLAILDGGSSSDTGEIGERLLSDYQRRTWWIRITRYTADIYQKNEGLERGWCPEWIR